MIYGHLDVSDDLDALPYNHAHAIEVARQAREARAILVDRLLGAQSATSKVCAEFVQSHMCQSITPTGPMEL